MKPPLVILRLVENVFILGRNGHFPPPGGGCGLTAHCLTLTGITDQVSMLGDVGGGQAVSGSALDAVELPAAGPRAEGGGEGGGRGGGPESVDQLGVNTSTSLSLGRLVVNLLGRQVGLATIVHPNVLQL